MRYARPILVGLSLYAMGCGKTDECRRLEEVLTSARHSLNATRARAQLADKTTRSLDRVQASTDRKLEASGLDLDEDALAAVLEPRAEPFDGARYERDTRSGEADPRTGLPRSEAVFRYTLPAESLAKVWPKVQALGASPPLTHFYSLIAPRGPKDPWVLELGAPHIDRISFEGLEPRAPPERKSAADVPEEGGFCGASDLREEIAEVEAELKTLEGKASLTTLNLPRIATLTGLSRRTDHLVAKEREARRILDALVAATLTAKKRLNALGADEDLVIYELRGSKQDLAEVKNALPTDLLQSVKDLDGIAEGVVRMAIANRFADMARPGMGGSHGTTTATGAHP